MTVTVALVCLSVGEDCSLVFGEVLVAELQPLVSRWVRWRLWERGAQGAAHSFVIAHGAYGLSRTGWLRLSPHLTTYVCAVPQSSRN